MWPLTKHSKGSPLPQHILNWPATLPEEPLDAADRDLIRNRWTQALDQDFTCGPEMRAAFQPPSQPLDRPTHHRGHQDMNDQQREIADMIACLPPDQPHSLPQLRACVAVLASLDLPDQAEKLGEYITWARDTGKFS